jgi:hypothetical protein
MIDFRGLAYVDALEAPGSQGTTRRSKALGRGGLRNGRRSAKRMHSHLDYLITTG